MTLIFIADDIPTKITMLPPLSLLLHARGKLFSACGVSLSFIHLIFSLFFRSAASGEQYKRW